MHLDGKDITYRRIDIVSPVFRQGREELMTPTGLVTLLCNTVIPPTSIRATTLSIVMSKILEPAETESPMIPPLSMLPSPPQEADVVLDVTRPPSSPLLSSSPLELT